MSKNKKGVEPVVMYARYSTKNQTELSIELQRAAAISFCSGHNMKIVAEYIDEAYSATSVNRPAFMRMMEDAKNGAQWRKVLIYDRSRFSRNLVDATTYEKKLNDYGVELISISRPLGSSPEDIMTKQIEDAMNNYAINKTAARTHAALSVKASQGLHCGGVPPLGYQVDPVGKLVIDTKEAEIVKLIFSMYLDGYSYSEMAEYLNEHGYKTKRNGLFTKNSFHSILSQEKYNGRYVWNKTTAKDSRSKRNSHSYKNEKDQIILEDKTPKIIDDEIFQQVQEQLKKRSVTTERSKSGARYVLGNLQKLKCGYCGSELVGVSRTSHGRSYTTYGCPQHRKRKCELKEIRADQLEQLVAVVLVKELISKDSYDTWKKQCAQSGQEAMLFREKKKLEKQIRCLTENLKEQYSSSLTQTLIEYEQSLKKINDSLTSYQGMPENSKENRLDFKHQMVDSLLEPGNVVSRHVLSTCLDEVVVDNTGIKISLNL